MYSVRRDYPRSFTQYMKVWGRLKVEILAQMNLSVRTGIGYDNTVSGVSL